MSTLAWVAPSCLSATASTVVDSVAKYYLAKYNADITEYTEWLTALLGLTTLPALVRARGLGSHGHPVVVVMAGWWSVGGQNSSLDTRPPKWSYWGSRREVPSLSVPFTPLS